MFGRREKMFISYSSKNDQFVREDILTQVNRAGRDHWFAPDDIRLGDNWRGKLLEALGTCDRLLVVVSKEAIYSSEWVKNEVETVAKPLLEKKAKLDARRVHRAILPVKVDERDEYGDKLETEVSHSNKDAPAVDHAKTTAAISVQCPCGKKLVAPGNLAGKRAKCPACGAAVEIPAFTRPSTMPTAASPELPVGDRGISSNPEGTSPDQPVDPYLIHPYLTMVNFITFPHNVELNKKLDPQTGKYLGAEDGLTKEQLKSVREYVKQRNEARRNLAIAIRNPDSLTCGFSRFARLLALFARPTSQRIALGIGLLVALLLLMRSPYVAMDFDNQGTFGTPQIIIEIEPLNRKSTIGDSDTSDPVVQTKAHHAAETTTFVSLQPNEQEPQDLDPPIEIKEISEQEASAAEKNVWSVRATDPNGKTITRYVQLVAKRVPRIAPKIEVTQIRDNETVVQSFAGPDWASEITVAEEPNTHLLVKVQGTKASRTVRLNSPDLAKPAHQQPVQTINSDSPQVSILASRDRGTTWASIERNRDFSVEDGPIGLKVVKTVNGNSTDLWRGNFQQQRPVQRNNSSPQLALSGSWDGGRNWEQIPKTTRFVDDGRLALKANPVSDSSTVIWQGMFKSPEISISGYDDERRTWRQLPTKVPYFIDSPKVLKVEQTVNGKATVLWEGSFIPPVISIKGREPRGTWKPIANNKIFGVDVPKALQIEKIVNGVAIDRWQGTFVPPKVMIEGSEAGGRFVSLARNNRIHSVNFPLKLRVQWTVDGKRPSILFEGTFQPMQRPSESFEGGGFGGGRGGIGEF